MLFSSLEFIFLFLPCTALIYVLLHRWKSLAVAVSFLAVASVFFYGYWKPQYVPVLLGSVAANYALSWFILPGRRRAHLGLALGIALNLGLLFYFKYAAFVSTMGVSLGWLDHPLLKKELPLGISFFTFQQIAYLVDRYRGLAPRGPFIRYLLFVTFFPQLIAGPIVHHQQMMPQLEHPRPTRLNIHLGLFIFALGFAKKIVLADPLGQLADAGFAQPAALPCLNAWLVVLAYTFQLYFDFSGYSDMAVGLGKLFGVNIPWNFLSPYKCTSIAAFWRNWHITLSNFLKDYVFIPLGGSRAGGARTSFNLFITLMLGGIWHGAGWTFVLWGVLHGLALVINHLGRRLNVRVPGWLGWMLTMTIVVTGWVLFRAATVQDALTLYTQMFRPAAGLRLDGPVWIAGFYLLLATGIAFLMPNTREWSERCRPTMGWSLVTGLIMAVTLLYVLGVVNPPEFLYYDF